jgi:hypothetical protein
MMFREELVRRVEQYVTRKGSVLGKQLGSGVHGSVFAVRNQTEPGRSAVKGYEQESHYRRERDVYLRLHERALSQLRGCAVPEMIEFDDALWIIEMTIVTRPFVLDFAGAYLDRLPDFPEEAWADWRAEKAEQFGVHWPEAQAILRELESYGIYMEDVSPGNISFAE